jgi:hypothetical protein
MCDAWPQPANLVQPGRAAIAAGGVPGSAGLSHGPVDLSWLPHRFAVQPSGLAFWAFWGKLRLWASHRSRQLPSSASLHSGAVKGDGSGTSALSGIMANTAPKILLPVDHPSAGVPMLDFGSSKWPESGLADVEWPKNLLFGRVVWGRALWVAGG